MSRRKYLAYLLSQNCHTSQKSKSLSSTIEFMTFELKMIYYMKRRLTFSLHIQQNMQPYNFLINFLTLLTLRVIIEFSKTFDTMDHKILITKLEKYWNKLSIHRLIKKLFDLLKTVCMLLRRNRTPRRN